MLNICLQVSTFRLHQRLSLLSGPWSSWGENLVVSRILGQTPPQPVSRGGEQVTLV